MSKPDPSITANLLNSGLGKTDTHQENAPKRQGKQNHTEGHGENPTPKPPKLKTAKNSASGQGRMRSTNRGK